MRSIVRTNRRAIATIVRPSVCLSVRLSGRGMHYDHTVHVSADLGLWLGIVQCSGHPDTRARPPTSSSLFPVPPRREAGYGCQTRQRIN